MKVAVTDCAEVIDTVQLPVPEQPAPDHPVKFESASAVADSTTLCPCGYDAEQVDPQLIPGTLVEVTVPDPDPGLDTDNV